MNSLKIIGVLGLARNGKDETANVLVRKLGYVRVAFANPIKRICMQVYDFSVEQMWGAAEKEAPDERYPREHTWEVDPERAVNLSCVRCLCCKASYAQMPHPQCYLTPRFALQTLGTEWGRMCYHATWEQYTMRIVKLLTEKGGFLYDKVHGLQELRDRRNERYTMPVVLPDVRFITETQSIQRAGGRVIRIKRPGFDTPIANHASETEQLRIPDDKLQGVIINDGDLVALETKICEYVAREAHR